MTRFAFVLSTILTLILVWTGCRLVLSQPSCSAPAQPSCCGHCPAAHAPYKVYSLADLGDDPTLGSWIAETIPAVIEPQTWQQGEGKYTVRYYPARRMLVVYHTAEVQEKVQAFLHEVKKNPPQDEGCGKHVKVATGPNVMPARFLTPVSTAEPAPGCSYPVAPPLQQPKHLFHFIIRYEGAGIIDDNVVKAIQLYTKKDKEDSDSKASADNAPTPPQPLVRQAKDDSESKEDGDKKKDDAPKKKDDSEKEEKKDESKKEKNEDSKKEEKKDDAPEKLGDPKEVDD
jgi:hypothetical protein